MVADQLTSKWCLKKGNTTISRRRTFRRVNAQTRGIEFPRAFTSPRWIDVNGNARETSTTKTEARMSAASGHNAVSVVTIKSYDYAVRHLYARSCTKRRERQSQRGDKTYADATARTRARSQTAEQSPRRWSVKGTSCEQLGRISSEGAKASRVQSISHVSFDRERILF